MNHDEAFQVVVGNSSRSFLEGDGSSVVCEQVTILPREVNKNLLLTECEGRTGEYWPKVVAVRTERSVQKRSRANIPQYGSS